MPSIFNVCTQPLDEQGQAKPCPCRYTRKCPDSTVKCDYGERYCKNCYTDENGKFHHEPAPPAPLRASVSVPLRG